jgi:two-component system KDP operon response regulator KdpE
VVASLGRPDLVVLDLGLRNAHGISALRALRRLTLAPILVLVDADATRRTVEALEAGADDYLQTPFILAELMARVACLLQEFAWSDRERLELGGLSIDMETGEARVGSRELELALVEFQILAALVRTPHRVLTAAMLSQEVWGSKDCTEASRLHLYAAKLRRTLAEAAPSRRYMVAEPGVGYRLIPPASQEAEGHSEMFRTR